MSANETIADIAAEKREIAARIRAELSQVPARREDQLLEADSLEREADRIEAAAKRVREATTEKTSAVGNAAAMREAIAKCVNLIIEFGNAEIVKTPLDVIVDIESILKSALSAPPRNCDRPECQSQTDAQKVWKREDRGKTAYYDWLLAPAEEGGAE